MKKVVSPQMVAHLWANQIQDEARTSGNNFYFYGPSIYSYGRHFCIARHIINDKGERATLMTTRGYSNTTTKHISIVRSATNHLHVIFCNDPSEGHYKNLEAFKRQIKSDLHGLHKAKKPEKYIGAAEYTFKKCKKYCEFFGLEIPSEIVNILESAKTGEYSEYLKREAERIEKERQEQEAEALAEAKKDLAKWRKFKMGRFLGRIGDRDFLRYNPTKKRIETTQGVEIPLEIAKRTYKWILKAIEAGGCDGNCNQKILDFDVKEVNKNFIWVGCHKVDIKEVKSMAKKLGW